MRHRVRSAMNSSVLKTALEITFIWETSETQVGVGYELPSTERLP